MIQTSLSLFYFFLQLYSFQIIPGFMYKLNITHLQGWDRYGNGGVVLPVATLPSPNKLSLGVPLSVYHRLLSISSDAESDPFLPVPMPDGIALCYTQSWGVLGREVLESPRCWGRAFYKQEKSHWKPWGEESLIRGSWMTSSRRRSADADFTCCDRAQLLCSNPLLRGCGGFPFLGATEQNRSYNWMLAILMESYW